VAVRVDRPEIFWELTRSLCPECRMVIDAQILFRDNRVIMRKRCPSHGWFEALVFGDAKLYADIAPYNKPGTLPLKFQTEVRNGCPHDCGLCPEHKQHACLGLIEVNSACNLDCPLCFANSGTHLARDGYELDHGQVGFMLDSFVAAEGSPEVVQLSGGEPTLHPLLPDFVAMAKDRGIRHVMINTNGLKLARDDRLLARLADLKPTIYLQFDGFDPATNLALRGREDLIETKLKTLDRLAQAGMRAVLVAAIERGVNDHEIGAIVDFGLSHPAVFGVNFQPAFRAQRHIAMDPLQRMTIPDVLKALELQTAGRWLMSDFVPVPCCMPTCNFVTYALLSDESVTPITRLVDVQGHLDYLKNRTLASFDADFLATLERLWSSSAPVGSDSAANDVHRTLAGSSSRCPACHIGLPLSDHAATDLARHVFMINTRDFMDPWTFNVKNVMKCCVEFIIPDGRLIPFCAYNSAGYREKVTTELHRAVRSTNGARR
jgi:7,8-dihydro-6-hydroxymethylpterin dimethyltransferase